MERVLRNFNLLRSFECSARHQSYSKAASELCISQAAVSQQMRQLENILGSQLFYRKGKQMLLTEKGQHLFSAAEQAFTILQKSLNEIRGEGIAGKLTITSTQAFTSLWLMPKLSKFSALYPEIEIRVLSSPSFDDLKQQHIDLAIRFGAQVEQNTDKKLACDYFGEDFVFPVCSAQLAKEMAFDKPGDLLKSRLVSLEKPGVYSWSSWFELSEITDYQSHTKWTQVHSTDMALNAVLNGHGVTLVAQYLCQPKLDSGDLVIPIDIAHPQSVKRYFVFDPDSAKKLRIQAFIDWLKAEIGFTTKP